MIHEKDKYIHFCSVCSKKFACASLATRHEKNVHFSKDPDEINSNNYDCDRCGAKKMSKKSLKKHLILIHHGEHFESSTTCDKCGKSFTNQRSLEDHRKQIHPTAEELAKVPCDCEKCNHIFPTALKLNNHLKECIENPPDLTCIICLSKNW